MSFIRTEFFLQPNTTVNYTIQNYYFRVTSNADQRILDDFIIEFVTHDKTHHVELDIVLRRRSNLEYRRHFHNHYLKPVDIRHTHIRYPSNALKYALTRFQGDINVLNAFTDLNFNSGNPVLILNYRSTTLNNP